MKYDLLVNVLSNFSPKSILKCSDDIIVHNAQLITTQYTLPDGGMYFNPDYIYVGYVSELPNDPVYAPHDSVLIEDIPVPEKYLKRDSLNMIIADKFADLMLLFNCVVFHMADDVRILQNELTYTQMINEEHSPNELLNYAYNILRNPIILISANNRVIATALGRKSIPPDVLEAVNSGVFTEDQIQKNFSVEYYSRMKRRGYIYSTKEMSLGKWVVVPISSKGFTLAYLLVSNSETIFFNSDFIFMDRLGELILLNLLRHSELYGTQGMMDSALFSDLLNKERFSAQELRERIDYLGWKSTDSMYILSIKPSGENDINAEVRQRLVDLFENCRWIIFEKELVMLLYIPEEEYSTQIENVGKILVSAGYTAGLSGRYSDLTETQHRYLQSKKANELGIKFRKEASLVTFDSVSVYEIAELLHSISDPVTYMPIGLSQLIRYDAGHNTSLFDTLNLYLKYGGLSVEAINELCISKSSAFYRLNKIREILRLNIEDGFVRTQLQIAIAAYQMYGTECLI